MGLKLFYFFLFLMPFSLAAQSLKQLSRGVELNAALIGSDTLNDDAVVFSFSIMNHNERTINIPSKYAVTGTPGGNIRYDLVYLSSDDQPDFADPSCGNTCFFRYFREDTILAVKQSYCFTTSIPLDFFSRKGKYKIRFYSQPSFYFNELPSVSTDWIAIDTKEIKQLPVK